MIPLYVLIGVWGGPGRLGATVKFVIYTMAGSLLMLAAVIVFGLSKDSFDLVTHRAERQQLALPRLRGRLRGQGAALPLHGWLPDAYRESSPEVAAVLSGVISKAAIFGFIRICFAKFPGPFDDFRNVILALAVDRACLRVAAGVPCAGHPRRDRLLEPRADGPDHDRRLRRAPRGQRRGPPGRQPRADLGDALPARRDDRATNVDRELSTGSVAWLAAGRPSPRCSWRPE